MGSSGPEQRNGLSRPLGTACLREGKDGGGASGGA